MKTRGNITVSVCADDPQEVRSWAHSRDGGPGAQVFQGPLRHVARSRRDSPIVVHHPEVGAPLVCEGDDVGAKAVLLKVLPFAGRGLPVGEAQDGQ